MVTISRTVDSDGEYYQIEDFDNYVHALREHNIEPPAAKYRVFIASETRDEFQRTWGDIKEQIVLFFRLGPEADIPYQIVDRLPKVPSAQ